MNKTNNHSLTKNSRELRKQMTKEERRLWYDFLKSLPVTINRQKVIGNYIVDFYCASAKTVIELDGSQHFELEGIEKDNVRDKYLMGLGLEVLRFSNYEINTNFEAVCDKIFRCVLPGLSEE
ncbi:MAG: endonuclease domain-containing protein [Lachnospiraceae bacterium]|nr:endonuclease domain-containing protein [Lachnospiraceae bacterium]